MAISRQGVGSSPALPISVRRTLHERLRRLDRQIGKLDWPIKFAQMLRDNEKLRELMHRRDELDVQRKQTRRRLKGYADWNV